MDEAKQLFVLGDWLTPGRIFGILLVETPPTRCLSATYIHTFPNTPWVGSGFAQVLYILLLVIVLEAHGVVSEPLNISPS